MTKFSEMVLNRLLDEVLKEPKALLAEALHARDEANASIIRLQRQYAIEKGIFENTKAQLDEARNKLNKQDGPLTAFYLAVRDYLDAKSSSRRQQTRQRLDECMRAAEPFIDLIPF
jgi:hypothetical protein